MTDQANDTENNPADQAGEPQTPAEDYTNLLTAITSTDGKPKYGSVATALGSIAPSQAHIKTLEEENAALKAEAAKSKSSAEILDQIVSATTNPATPAEPAAESMDKEAINQLVIDTLNNKTQADQAAMNQEVVAKALSKVYGSKAVEVFEQKAKETGVSVEFMKDVISKSPEAAMKLLGLEGTDTQVTNNIEGSHNTEGFNHSPPTKNQPIMGNYDATHEDNIASWRAHKPS